MHACGAGRALSRGGAVSPRGAAVPGGPQNRRRWFVPGRMHGSSWPRAPRLSVAVSEELGTDDGSPAATSTPWLSTPTPGAVWSDDKTRFAQSFRVRGYEVSPNQKASMVTMANLLQEIASNHAVGMWGRSDKGFAGLPDNPDLVFVMTRLQIRMHAYPRWGASLDMSTFFAEDGRLAARRDWVVSDEESGAEVGLATSTWVNINMATRRLVKLPDDIRNKLLAFAVPKDTWALPPGDCKQKLPDLDDASATAGPAQIARRSDMDMNGHINNVIYIAWALESVPTEVYDEYSLYEIEIDYKNECTAGETVSSFVQDISADDDGRRVFLHSLRRTDDDSGKVVELVRARTTWAAPN